MTYKELFDTALAGMSEGNKKLITAKFLRGFGGRNLEDEISSREQNEVLGYLNRNIDRVHDDDKHYLTRVWNTYKDALNNSDIVKAFEGVSRDDINLRLAEYNGAHPKFKVTADDVIRELQANSDRHYAKVMSAEERAMEKQKELEAWLNTSGPEQYEKYKKQKEWEDSMHKPIVGASYVVDALGGMIPGPIGYLGGAIGPAMRAYDEYRTTGDVDWGGVGYDLMTNEAGQALGGNISRGAASVLKGLSKGKPASRFSRGALLLDEAATAGRVDRSSWRRPFDRDEMIREWQKRKPLTTGSWTPDFENRMVEWEKQGEALRQNFNAVGDAGRSKDVLQIMSDEARSANAVDGTVSEAEKLLQGKLEKSEEKRNLKKNVNSIYENTVKPNVKKSKAPGYIQKADDVVTKVVADIPNFLGDSKSENEAELGRIGGEYWNLRKAAEREKDEYVKKFEDFNRKYPLIEGKNLSPETLKRYGMEVPKEVSDRWSAGGATLEEKKTPAYRNWLMLFNARPNDRLLTDE